MFAELIETIVGLADKARKPVTLTASDPRKQFVVMPDGQIKTFDIPPAAHKEQLETPEELARFVTEQMDADKAIVYVLLDRVTALYDRDDRRDFARCDLPVHEQWKFVRGLAESGKQLGQREFYRMLRVTLKGCATDGGDFEGRVKTINFQTSDSGTSAVSAAAHTMGRELVARVSGTEALPEEVVLSVPVWDGVDFRVPVRCAVEIFPEARTFALTPYPGEVDAGEEAAIRFMQETIEGGMPGSVKVYLGRPEAK